MFNYLKRLNVGSVVIATVAALVAILPQANAEPQKLALLIANKDYTALTRLDNLWSPRCPSMVWKCELWAKTVHI
jgi:hypothetical protein